MPSVKAKSILCYLLKGNNVLELSEALVEKDVEKAVGILSGKGLGRDDELEGGVKELINQGIGPAFWQAWNFITHPDDPVSNNAPSTPAKNLEGNDASVKQQLAAIVEKKKQAMDEADRQQEPPNSADYDQKHATFSANKDVYQVVKKVYDFASG